MNLQRLNIIGKSLSNYWAILLITILFCSIVIYFLPIRYETNDDITYAWIASGVYTGTPDGHLVFLSAIYGYFVSWLYILIPAVEWYSILFIIFLAVSWSIIIWYATSKIDVKMTRWNIVIISYIILLYLLLNLQFTMVAGSLAFASLLLLIERRFYYGGVLLLLASLIRFQAAGLVGLMMMPALVIAYVNDWKKNYLYLGIILLMVIGAHYANTLFYQTPEFKTFMQRTRYMCEGAIQDNPNCWRVRMNLPDGVTTTNFDLIVGFCADAEVTTPEMVMAIHQSLLDIPITKKVKNIYQNMLPTYWIWFVCFFCTFLILVIKKDRKRLLYTIGIYIYWLAILSFVSLNATAKARVFICTLMPILYYVTSLLTTVDKYEWRMWVSNAGLISIISWGVMMPVIQRISCSSEHDAIIKEQMALYNQAGELKVVTDGADLRVEYFDALHLRDAIPSGSFVNPYCFAGFPLVSYYHSHKEFVDGNLCIFSAKPYKVKDDMRIKGLKENYNIEVEPYIIAESANYVLVRYREVKQ